MFGILCFGDSITFGRGDSVKDGWVAKLREYFESKDFFNGVYNLGICGQTSNELLKRFETEADSRISFKRSGDRYLVLIGIGTNDSRGMNSPNNVKVSLKQYKQNIKELANLAKSKTKEVVFIGLIPVDDKLRFGYEDTYFSNERIQKYNDIIKQLCEEKNIPFINLFNDFKNQDNYEQLLADGLHPNNKGYEFMYIKIKEFLIKNRLIN